jgi:hypothetical protein
MLYSVVGGYQCLGGTCCLLSSTMKIVAADFCETLTVVYLILCHNPQPTVRTLDISRVCIRLSTKHITYG